MSGDAHTSNRFGWLERIAGDDRLTASAIRVAVILSKFINRESGEAWPSLKTLAAETRMPERTVGYAIKVLCEAGHLGKRRAGFGKSNRYVMTGNSPQDGGEPSICSKATDCQNEERIPAMDCQNEPSIPATYCRSFWQPVADHSGNALPPIPLIETSDIETSELKDISPPSPSFGFAGKGRGGAEGFERFYQVFPRKAGRGAARKAWEKAIKAADPEAIIAGAERYAVERAGQEPRFTAHPSTWLNAERWTDEPAPNGEHGRWRSAKDRTGDAIHDTLAQCGGDHEH
jgi:hypothetical protein